MMRCVRLVHGLPALSIHPDSQDLAFEIDCDGFKWHWETYLLGPKTSADVISRHLIMPLISVVHISFYSADPVSELEESDLEKVRMCVHESPAETHGFRSFFRPLIELDAPLGEASTYT